VVVAAAEEAEVESKGHSEDEGGALISLPKKPRSRPRDIARMGGLWPLCLMSLACHAAQHAHHTMLRFTSGQACIINKCLL
jgi:hypothetical protein